MPLKIHKFGPRDVLFDLEQQTDRLEVFVILKLYIPRNLAVNHFFLFQPNARNVLNTYIYR
jgi:hypothetical protein